jgi:hypothetical protein
MNWAVSCRRSSASSSAHLSLKRILT